MKPISPALALHLAGEVTTLARCWVLSRFDGVVFGFTDHDRDIVFGDVTFRAATGLDAAEASAELGFAVGGGDVAGALNSAGLTENDLAAGRYDGANVTSWLVNWDDPEQRLVTATSVIGEVKRTDVAFVAELRGTAHRFDEERGRLFTQNCPADLGDAQCGYAIGTYYGAVASTDGRLALTAISLATLNDGWFTGGKLTFTGGPNDGFATEVFHTVGTLATITSFSVPQPGLMVIRCSGAQRFEISNREKLKHGLWIADVKRLDDDQVVRVPEDLRGAANALGKLIKTLQDRAIPADQMPLEPPYRLDDCGWVANRWCELLPIPTAAKQKLMELEDPMIRLSLVDGFLRDKMVVFG